MTTHDSDEYTEQLPSGLYVFKDKQPEPEPEQPDSGLVTCAHCQKTERVQRWHLFLHRLSNGWFIEHPTCGHGRYIVCTDCVDNWRKDDPTKTYGCPVCGSAELYC